MWQKSMYSRLIPILLDWKFWSFIVSFAVVVFVLVTLFAFTKRVLYPCICCMWGACLMQLMWYDWVLLHILSTKCTAVVEKPIPCCVRTKLINDFVAVEIYCFTEEKHICTVHLASATDAKGERSRWCQQVGMRESMHSGRSIFRGGAVYFVTISCTRICDCAVHAM